MKKMVGWWVCPPATTGSKNHPYLPKMEGHRVGPRGLTHFATPRHGRTLNVGIKLYCFFLLNQLYKRFLKFYTYFKTLKFFN